MPFMGIALVLALTLKQIPLSDTAGMVARGEAMGGEEAERLEAARLEPHGADRWNRVSASAASAEALDVPLHEAAGAQGRRGELAGQRS